MLPVLALHAGKGSTAVAALMTAWRMASTSGSDHVERSQRTALQSPTGFVTTPHRGTRGAQREGKFNDEPVPEKRLRGDALASRYVSQGAGVVWSTEPGRHVDHPTSGGLKLECLLDDRPDGGADGPKVPGGGAGELLLCNGKAPP
jgi:hypothetical protein